MSDIPRRGSPIPARGCLPFAVIVNPAAANGGVARRWPRLARALQAQGVAAEVFFTSSPADGTKLARQALRSGHDTIVAVGGDGTINEVVNGFFDEGRPINLSARLGILSYGTGSDFVRSVGLPKGEAAIPHLVSGRAIAVDVGLASFRDFAGRATALHFLNFADLGLGGETVRRVNRTSKAFGGFASFFLGAVLSILSYRAKPAELFFDNAGPVCQTVGDIVAANGRYFGGGMLVAPEASLTDGLFDVFVLGDVPKVQLLFDLLPRVYRGTHVGHPKVWSRRASRLIVRSTQPLLLDLDGELVGQAEAELSIVPRTLQVIVPSNGRCAV